MIKIHNEIVYISNFSKILSIDDQTIILMFKQMKIKIDGLKLMIRYLSKDDIEIHGKITKVEFYE